MTILIDISICSIQFRIDDISSECGLIKKRETVTSKSPEVICLRNHCRNIQLNSPGQSVYGLNDILSDYRKRVCRYTNQSFRCQSNIGFGIIALEWNLSNLKFLNTIVSDASLSSKDSRLKGSESSDRVELLPRLV